MRVVAGRPYVVSFIESSVIVINRVDDVSKKCLGLLGDFFSEGFGIANVGNEFFAVIVPVAVGTLVDAGEPQ